MKKILFSKSFMLYIIIVLCIGYFVGYDTKNDFLNIYIGKMTLLPFRYILLTLIVLVSNFVCNSFFNSAVIVRNKNSFNLFLTISKYEFFTFLIIYICLNIPVLIFNFNPFIDNLFSIIVVILNSVLISLICSSIIKLIDIKFKNRVLSSCTFLVCLSLFDFILEHFNFYVFADNVFDFSYIFALPIIYNNYIIILIFLILIYCLLTSSVINLAYKRDYFLRHDTK